MKESNFKFKTPTVTKMNYLVNTNFSNCSQVNISNSFNIEINKASEENKAIVKLNILVGTSDFTESIPFCVDMTISSIFSWDNIYDEETLQKLLSQNAPALLLGYARPIISNITSVGPFGCYDLPFYNFLDN